MTPYYIAIGCSCLLLFIAEKMRDASRDSGRPVDIRATFVACLAAVPLIALIGLRSYEVGTDTRSYVSYFFEVCGGSTDVMGMNNSPLFYVFVRLAAWVSGGDYTVFLLLEGVLLSAFLLSAFWRDSEMPWLSLLLFLCFGFAFELVNQYRQMLACAILLFSFRYYADERMGHYAFWVLVASGFHPAALVMLVLVFISKVELNLIKILASFAMMILLGASFGAVESIVSRIPYFGEYIGSAFDSEITAMTVLNFVFRAGIFIVLYQIRNEIVERAPKMRYVYPILLLGVMFQAAAVCSTAFGRLPTFAICFFVLLIPAAIKGSKSSAIRLSICLGLFFALLAANIAFKDYSDFEYELATDETVRLSF